MLVTFMKMDSVAIRKHFKELENFDSTPNYFILSYSSKGNENMFIRKRVQD